MGGWFDIQSFIVLARKARQQQQQQNGKNVSSNGWADEDVDGFKEKEFDFQANLSMFDKEKVFAEIRASIQGDDKKRGEISSSSNSD